MRSGIFLCAGAFASVALAQSPGAFAATGNMNNARTFHTATLLNDGRVLIAGGATDNSAELYDPATGVFTLTGNMTTARTGHSATLLPDGRVLIAGGRAVRLGTAEIYDPTSGTFTATGDMLRAFGEFNNATLLTNGKVLITWPDGFAAELYDPASGSFSPAGAYASGAGLCDFCSPPTLLPDGGVLVSAVQPAQLYDPGSATFSATGSMIFPDHTTATLLMNGSVLLTGGEEEGRSASAELYDQATGSFTSTGNMIWRRVGHSATLLPDGTVLVAGGETDSCAGNTCMFAGTVSSAEIYDPATGKFSATGGMAVSREVHTATLLRDGRVLITGGVGYGGIGLYYGGTSSAELFTPAVLVSAPALFSLSGDGQGQGAIWHSATGLAAAPSSPAVAGEILAMYTTSLGDDGVIPPQVAVGGRLAEVLYFGAAPNYPGYYQVNFRIPSGVAPGSTIPVRLSYLGRSSNAVTIGVQ